MSHFKDMCWCFDVSDEWFSTSSTCHSTFGHLQFKAHWKEFDSTSTFGGISFAATWTFACLWNGVVKQLAFSMTIRTWIQMNMFWRCSLTLIGLQTVSVSCCIVMFGSAWYTQHQGLRRSSAEAEVYACSSGASDAILLARLLTWITNKRTHIYIYTDSSGAKGILNRRSWTFETLELPHLVVAGYGWKWNAEAMQHQRPFEARWHRNKMFSFPENEIFDEFAWFVHQIKWMFGRSRWSRTSFCSKGQPQSPCLRLEPDPTSFTRMWFNLGRWL